MCDIPNTLLSKISRCGIFLCDLTFVTESRSHSGAKKRHSNPNVIFEFGYAVRSIGFDRVIAVMNTAYGHPNEQMFDTKRRHAITFSLGETATEQEIQAEADSLGDKLFEAIQLILEKSSLNAEGDDDRKRFADLRNSFHASVRSGHFGGGIYSSPAIALTIVPSKLAELTFERISRLHLPVLGKSGWDPEYHGNSVGSVWTCRDKDGKSNLRCSISELTTDGVIAAADTFVLADEFHPQAGVKTIVPSIAWERDIIGGVFRFAEVLQSLNLPLPWRVGTALLGVRGYRFLSNESSFSRILAKDDIVPEAIVVLDFKDVADYESVARTLKPIFDFVAREFGLRSSPNYDNSGGWRSENFRYL